MNNPFLVRELLPAALQVVSSARTFPHDPTYWNGTDHNARVAKAAVSLAIEVSDLYDQLLKETGGEAA